MPDLSSAKRMEIPYRAFPLMAAIHASPARFRVVCCGRRGGKSKMANTEGFCMSLDAARRGVTKPRGVIVAPTNAMLRENWWDFTQTMKAAIQQTVISELRVDLGVLGQVDFKSTESQGGAGRGAGYDWAVLDEASRIPPDAWESDIRPALSDRQGRALMISTPRGLNWFYDLYQRGQPGSSTADSAFASWQATTLDCWRSRFATQPEQLAAAEAEMALIQRTTSESKFREEYGAEFLAGEGQLFSLKPGLWRGTLREAVPGRHYVAGVDVARKDDWMVTAILEVESQQLVGLTRSRHQDWALQKAASLALLDRFPGVLTYIDSTGVGDPIAQDFRSAGVNAMDVLFTPKVKSELVENLLVAIDQTYLGLPETADTAWLVEELRQYEVQRQPSGALKYGAPDGRHDDGVTALMLACWGLKGNWRTPNLAEVVQPKWWERTDNPWEHLAYEQRVAAFRRRFPHQPVPQHPTDWSWTRMERR